jgi:hypothetical protein
MTCPRLLAVMIKYGDQISIFFERNHFHTCPPASMFFTASYVSQTQRKKHSIKLYKRFEWRKHLHPRAAAAPGIKEAKYRSVKVAICSMPEPTAAGIITAMTCQQSKSQKPSWFLRINNLHKTVGLCINIVSNAIYKCWLLFARQL